MDCGILKATSLNGDSLVSVTHKLLDPKNDVACKRLFGTVKNKDILIHFLNDMLVFNGKPTITNVEFIPTLQDPELIFKKTSIVDVMCTDKRQNKYIVEMQVAKSSGFEKRAQYYAAKAYSAQANVGSIYKDLKEVVFLAIADYVMFPKKKAIKSDHVILDKETYEQDLQDFSFTFLELPKFKKAKEAIDHLTDDVEKWCYFFRYADDITPDVLKQLTDKDHVIEKAYDELNRFYWTEDELMAYEEVEKRERDYVAVLDQKFDDGMEKGIEKGIERGIEKGVEIGKAEGLVEGERNAKHIMARGMIKDGMNEAMIMKYTGLTAEEVTSLKTAYTTNG